MTPTTFAIAWSALALLYLALLMHFAADVEELEDSDYEQRLSEAVREWKP